MAQKSPNAIDVLDIQFKLYAKTKILNVSESIPNNVSLLAVSNTQGLLFVGEPEKAELKVFMLNNLVDTENVCNDILARSFPLPGVPNIIVCSCDGSMLAVSFMQNGSSFLQIYHVPSFLTANVNTLNTIKLSPDENVSALQILWNPVISSNLAIVLSNGALGMFTLKDSGQYEMHNLDKSQQVQCGCWSPKGKQIVLGFANGKLQQFKPDLTPAKTIACPNGIHTGPFSTIAVHWLSTFQFAAAFVQDGVDMIPSLYIINAPKGGTPSYINYFDICYTTGQRAHQIHFTHIQQWNLLLVVSANGIEVGLLGCKESGENPTWIQYTLLDEARIEMPLTESKEETFPFGLAYDTSCTHHLIVNDKEIPVMPMIHVLSTNGQLLSFNFLNLTPGAADVCSPPPPISYNTQQFRPLTECLKTEISEAAPVATEPDKPKSVIPSGLVSSTPVMKDKAPQFFGNTATTVTSQPFEQLSGFGNIAKSTANIAPVTQAVKPVFSGFGGLGGGVTAAGISQIGGIGVQQQKLDQQQSTQIKPQTQPHLQQQQHHQQQQQQQQLQHQKPQQSSTVAVSGVKSSELNKPLYTVPSSFTPPTIAASAQGAQPQKSQSNLTITSKMQSGFLELIVVQINAFDKEIKQLAAQSKGLLKNLGNPDEMRGCTKRLNDLQEIIEQANDHEFEMDVQNLRHFLNEARSMIAECRWKLEKYNNPDLPRLGNNISDSVNRRQLAKLQAYVSTNEAQSQVLKQQIDAQWSNFQDSVRRNTKSQIHIPCLDGIYQRMTKLQELLSRHRQKLNQIKLKLQQNGLLYKLSNPDTTRGTVKADCTIDSLADSIISMTLSKVVDEHRSKLSYEKLRAIREFTQQRQKVNIIKAQRPNRVGLKSEVVLETMLQSERIKARENNAATLVSKEKFAEATESQTAALPKSEMTKPALLPTQASTVFSFNTKAPNSFTQSTIPAVKDAKAGSTSFNFKTPPALSSFGIPVSVLQTQPATSSEQTKIGLSTPEEEVPGVAQVPISFAAKVISGTNTISKNSTSIFAPPSTAVGFSNPKSSEETTKPFSFTVGTPSAAGVSSTKPPMFDLKSGTGFSSSFNFGGFPSAAVVSNISTTPTAVSSLTSASTATVATSTANAKPTAGPFNGFGKSVSADNNSAALNLSPANSVSGPTVQNPIKSTQATVVSTIPTNVVQAESVTSSNTKTSAAMASTPSTTMLPDSTDTLFDSLNICKPTTKPVDLSKSPTASDNIFAGLGASSGLSFIPVTGAASSTPFADLAKSLSTASSLTITPVTTTAPTTPAPTTTAPTPTTPAATSATTASTTSTTTKDAMPTTTIVTAAVSRPTSSPVDVVKPSDFTFSLSSLGTSITTTTTTTLSLPATTSVTSSSPSVVPPTASTKFSSAETAATPSSVPSGIFASAAFQATAAVVSSASSNIFGGSGATSFFTSTATPTTTTTSSAGTIFGTPAAAPLTSSFGGFSIGTAASTAPTTPATGGSIFATANSTSNSSPPSTNIFGGIPKPDQSVFGGSATQSPTTGGNLFSNATASPFGGTATSPPPNQTVGNGIFGGASDGFAKSTGSIFGGSVVPATSAPVVSSPFGGTAATTVAPGGSIFGSPSVKPADGGSIFSGASAQPAAATTGGSIFGQSGFGQAQAAAAPTSNLFGGGASAHTAFSTGGSIFGGAGAATTNTSAASGGSIFGGGITTQSSFSSPASATGSTGFGAFSQQNTASPFGSPGASSGPFGQGGASVAQTGFGSPQQTSGFGKPTFGGPATFGSPPAFGAQPTFGGAPMFGAQKPFGSFAAAAPTSPATGVFGGGAGSGGIAQKNNLFETLGASDTGPSFGNLAQGANPGGPKPPFGGSSFTSYRS